MALKSSMVLVHLNSGEHKKDESADFNKNDQYWAKSLNLTKYKQK